jgi:hypothetical protein
MLVFFIALFGFYVCYFSFTQLSLENDQEEEMNGAEERRTKVLCTKPSEIPYRQMKYVHFPRPMNYDRYSSLSRHLASIMYPTLFFRQGECSPGV